MNPRTSRAAANRVLLSEVRAQWCAERWRAVLLCLVAGVLAAVAALADLNQLQRSLHAQRTLLTAGQHVFIATPATAGTPLDAGPCLALAQHPGVKSAGGFVSDQAVTLVKSPGGHLTLRGYVGSMPQILTAKQHPDYTDGPGQAAMPSTVATHVGVAAGELVQLMDEPALVRVQDLDIDDRVPDPGTWLLYRTAPHGPLAECWAEFDPSTAEWAKSIMQTRLTPRGGEVLIRPVLPEDSLRTSPAATYQDRPTRYLGAMAGGTAAVTMLLVTWFRRAEIALYRSIGLPVLPTALIYAIPLVLLLLVAIIAGSLTATTLHGLPNLLTWDHVRVVLTQALQMACVGTVIVTLTTTIITTGSISNYIRDRI